MSRERRYVTARMEGWGVRCEQAMRRTAAMERVQVDAQRRCTFQRRQPRAASRDSHPSPSGPPNHSHHTVSPHLLRHGML